MSDDEAYRQEMALLDHKLMAINRLRTYSRKYYVGDFKHDTLNHQNIEEIVKAHSKTADDALEAVAASYKS